MISLIVMAAASAAASAPLPLPKGEMALRCSVEANAPLFARNAAAIAGPLSGGPAPAPVMKPMPQLMVEGWSVDALPIADALGQLAVDAGFTVEADPGLSSVSWKSGPTPLSTVVARLAQASGGVPSFDGKVLKITKPMAAEPWRFKRPSGRDATLALLDALRGYGATEVSLSEDAVSFRASDATVARIRKGVTASASVLAFDVWTFRVKGAPDWKRIDEMAPVSERHPVGPGGRFVTSYVSPDRFSKFLAEAGETRDLGSQTVAGPQGWAMDVPLSQCAGSNEKTGSLMIKPVWDGKTMSVDLSGAAVDSGRIDALPPGSTAIVSRLQPDGWSTVALIRPRILSPR